MLARVKSPFAAGEYDVRLQRALRMAKVGAWHIDLRTGEQVWSREVADLFGLPVDTELSRELLKQAIHPDDRERVRAIIRHAAELGSGFELDCRIVWPDATVHWLRGLGNVRVNRKGGVIAFEGVLQDVDDRKRLELALEESQRSLRTLISHLPGLVYRLRNDAKWTAEFVSDGVATLTGRPPHEFTSGEIAYLDLVHPEDRERVREAVASALRERTEFQLTYRVQHTSGEVRHVWERGAAVYGGSGEVRYIEGLAIDVTDHMRSEQERVRLEARLLQAQKMQALGTLAGGIAHDFNNVLTVIKGNAALARADTPPDSPTAVSLLEIERSAQRAAELVRQILAFSRQDPSQRRPMSLTSIAEDALRMLRSTLPTLIEIRSESPAGLPNVLADPIQVHQVITNLGVNAAQAIGNQAGWIDVRLAQATLTDAQAREALAPRPGDYVCLTMTDSGCGMDAGTVARIFDPFFTTKPAGQGVGLGLSLVHSIMQAHEGGVAVESTPGAGATFRLYFPVAAPEETIAPSPPAPAPRGRDQHILFVDDEEPLVFLAQRFFPRFGYRITGCETPEQALALFREHPDEFDFVVTDLTMPTMSGHDLARELRRIRSDIPIVLASGYLRDEDVAAARAIGVDEVIAKPSTMDELVSKIHGALLRSAQQRQEGNG